jgi:hypothetical protein
MNPCSISITRRVDPGNISFEVPKPLYDGCIELLLLRARQLLEFLE